MAISTCLVDTNILLRLVRKDDPQHEEMEQVARNLELSGTRIFFTTQSLAEFWNVCTRPVNVNGYGLELGRVNQMLDVIEERFLIAFDNQVTLKTWRRLVVMHSVKGVQVHDARLAARALAHGMDAILTLNVVDFRRYGVRVVLPKEVLEGV